MRKSLVRLMALLLVIVPLLGAWANESSAASSRVAVIKELKGTVKVKKAGGSKEFTGFAKMSLNEGDVLSVSSGGSAVLQFANGTSEDDKMTVAANTKLSFSKLSNKKGTTTKVSMWSGSAWVDVKSITNSADEFTLETPTAVMGVRGTHFIAAVDPLTGSTQLSVAAGIVKMLPPSSSIGTVLPQQHLIYPSQTILALPNLSGVPTIMPAPIDPTILVNQAGPALIEAMLRSGIEIQKENQRLMERYINEQTIQLSDLDKIKGNIDNLVSVIANQAIKSSTINSIILGNIQEELLRTTGKQLDLKVKEFQLSDEEKKQQELLRLKDKLAKEDAEKKKKDEEKARDKELQDKLKKIHDDKKKATEEELKKKKDKAFKDYESKLDELEKERLKKDKKLREEEQSSGPATQSSGGSGQSNPTPAYTSPLKSLKIVHYELNTGETSGSPRPVFDQIPLSQSEYTFEATWGHPMLNVVIEKLDSGELEDGDIKVMVNGVPTELDMIETYNEATEEYVTMVGAEIFLDKASNTITFDVKPKNHIATAANTHRFTLKVNRPSISESFHFTSTINTGESVNWLPNDEGLTAFVETPVTSITFAPILGVGFDSMTLSCDSNCDGLSATNLQPGETYELSLTYYLNDEETFTLPLTFKNGYEATPNDTYWAELFEDTFTFIEDNNSDYPLDLVMESGVYTTNVDADTQRLSVEAHDDNILGVWDERNWEFRDYSNDMACNESSGFCLDDLEVGDNHFTFYMSDEYGAHSHGIEVNIRKRVLPKGISVISATYSNYLVTDVPLAWNTVTNDDLSDSFGYYVHIDNEEQNTVTLDLTIDGTQISEIYFPDDYDDIHHAIDNAPGQSLSIDLSDFEEGEVIGNGLHSYTMVVTYRNEDVHNYDMHVLVGERDPGLRVDYVFGENGPWIARYAGDNKWIIPIPEGQSEYSLSLYVMNEPASVRIQGYGNYYDSESDVYRVTGLISGTVNTVTLTMLDVFTGEPYRSYELIIYNGIPELAFEDFELTDMNEHPTNGILNYDSDGAITLSSSVQTGKSLIGVYNAFGEPISPVEGNYTLTPWIGGMAYYFVVKDDETGFIVPTKITASVPV